MKAFDIADKLNSPAEEAYNVLSTNIQYYELDKKIRTLAVTSWSPGDGKTTTAVNLSISIAKSGMKVLFVDMDLRKPIVMKHLGSNTFKGLSNLLAGSASLDEVINATNIEGFSFISCGVKPLNPIDLIESERFTAFLETVKKQFDMIIIDTPPMGSVIDCAIIAAQMDGTLIVIKPHVMKYMNMKMMKEQLEKVNAKILGVVLNNVSKNDYKVYYDGYDYYGSQNKYHRNWIKQLKNRR
jgi:protein-tyrosine kinase